MSQFYDCLPAKQKTYSSDKFLITISRLRTILATDLFSNSKYRFMKKQMMWMGVLLLTALAGQAQNIKPKNNTREKRVLKNERMQQPSASPYHGQESTVLNSTSSYPAFRRPADSFKIADPTIRALDANAKGANLKLGPSGLVGVPKGTYGFANGKIRLYPSGATSTGTTTGMGSVGTGSSTGAVGSSGPTMGVNGKNPYASPGAYGTRIPFSWKPAIDSVKNINTQTRY